jgi:phosphoribosylanthranilate isomerase
VKVCGITRPEDAVLAAELGASAIGLVFWPASPRYVTPEQAREIVSALPAFVSTVGVFVNQAAEARAVAQDLRLSAVQLHGDENVEDYRGVPCHVIKAVAVNGESAREAAASLPAGVTVLLDAHDPVKRGGTGRVIDWSVASEIASGRRVVLSGGLHAGNVADAIAAVRPYAIDVSSGVESAPGQKDPAKLRALFDALHANGGRE